VTTNATAVAGFPGFIPAVPAHDSSGVRSDGTDGNDGSEQPPRPPAVRVAGPEDAGRSLTLDLGGLIGQISSMPDPDPEVDDYTRAGVQLLSALQDGCLDFGLASPGTSPDDSAAERIMNITDEAFEAAGEFLMVSEELEETDHPPGYLPGHFREHLQDHVQDHVQPHVQNHQRIGGPTLAALLLELRSYSIRDEMRAVRSLPAATDRRLAEIGGPFF